MEQQVLVSLLARSRRLQPRPSATLMPGRAAAAVLAQHAVFASALALMACLLFMRPGSVASPGFCFDMCVCVTAGQADCWLLRQSVAAISTSISMYNPGGMQLLSRGCRLQCCSGHVWLQHVSFDKKEAQWLGAPTGVHMDSVLCCQVASVGLHGLMSGTCCQQSACQTHDDSN